MPAKVVSISSASAKFLARRNALVEANLELVAPIARSILSSLPPSFELDDLISAGNLGLVKAATRFRPSVHGGAPFSAYARPVIRGAILDSIRRANWAFGNALGEDAIPETPVVVAIDEAIDRKRQSRRVRSAVAELSERHQEVIQGYYYDECAFPAIGEAIGVSRSRASQLHVEAVRELRGSLR
jgi:RNA polymerase sigma factor (sigma-70 family)